MDDEITIGDFLELFDVTTLFVVAVYDENLDRVDIRDPKYVKSMYGKIEFIRAWIGHFCLDGTHGTKQLAVMGDFHREEVNAKYGKKI